MAALKVTHIATVIGYRVGILALACYSAVSLAATPTVTAQQFVDLQQGDSEHRGFRRAHAKGICVSGEFNANGNLSTFTMMAKMRYKMSWQSGYCKRRLRLPGSSRWQSPVMMKITPRNVGPRTAHKSMPAPSPLSSGNRNLKDRVMA